MKKNIVIIIVLLLFLLTIIGILFAFDSETDEMQFQEDIGEQIADKYLIDISKEYLEQENTEIVTGPTETYPSDLEYDDNEIYSYYDESDAHGHVDCVLEIPAINLRQSIFTGTVEQIQHDLSKWLAVTARSDYILGSSQYCIYMHNPRDKSIQISLAQETLKAGDYMVVTQKGTVYLYSITNVFSEWRNKCSEKYVNAFNVGSDKLYIFTCARGEWQGKNLVIEGTVYEAYSLTDWTKNQDEYIAKYKNEINGVISDVIEKNTRTHINLNLSTSNDCISAHITSDNYTNANCTIGIFNEDGYLLDIDNNPIPVENSTIYLPKLSEGKYYIGIYECDENYYSDVSYCVTINKDSSKIDVITFDEQNKSEIQSIQIAKVVAISLIVLVFLIGILIIIKNSRKK